MEAYLLKLGIFRVDWYSWELPKGLSKDEDLEASDSPLRCWQEATAARVVGSCWRAQARSRVLEAEESDMMRLSIAVIAGRWVEGRRVEGGREQLNDTTGGIR